MDLDTTMNKLNNIIVIGILYMTLMTTYQHNI